MPAADRVAVVELALARGADAEALLSEVTRTIEAADAIDLGETPLQSKAAGPEFKARHARGISCVIEAPGCGRRSLGSRRARQIPCLLSHPLRGALGHVRVVVDSELE